MKEQEGVGVEEMLFPSTLAPSRGPKLDLRPNSPRGGEETPT